MLEPISPRKNVRQSRVPDDDVNCIHTDPTTGKTYVGGFFESWGPNTGSYGFINKTTGILIPTWNDWAKTNDYSEDNGSGGNYTDSIAVSCAIPDGDGGWYIGGNFTRIGGIERWSVARVNADGSVNENFNVGYISDDTPGSSFPEVGWVCSMHLSGNRLLIAGLFQWVGGVPRRYLAAVDADTGAVLEPNYGLDDMCWVIASGESGLYVGGEFETILGQTRHNLARFIDSTATGIDPNFVANINFLGPFSSVYDIHVVSGAVAIAGDFNDITGNGYGPVIRQNAALIDPATSEPIVSFANPFIDGDVYQIRYDTNNSRIYIGGVFSSVNAPAVTRIALAALDDLGVVIGGFDPSPNNEVTAITLGGSGIFVGGSFSSIGGFTRRQLAEVASDGTVTSWNPHPGDQTTVRCIVDDGSNLLIGGNFSSLNSTTTGGIAALNTDGTVTALAAGSTTVVRSVLTLDFAGERKIVVGESSALRLIDENGTQDWSIVTNGQVNAIHHIAGSSTIYVGGTFTTINATSRARIAEINLSDGTVTSSAITLTGTQIRTITSIGSSPTELYIGGAFTVVNGASRNNAATVSLSLNGVGGWNPNINGTVFQILPSYDGNSLYIAGAYTTVNGVAGERLSEVDATNGTLTGFGFTPGDEIGHTCQCLALNEDGTRLYVGGSFEFTDSNNPNLAWQGVAEVDTGTGAVTFWNPNLESQPPQNTTFGSFADADAIDYNPFTKLVSAGGDITDVNSFPQRAFAQWLVPDQINVIGIDQSSGQLKPLETSDVAVNTVGGTVFGITGIQGVTGAIGATGWAVAGQQGLQGLRGETGLLGAQGLTGVQATGFQGLTGVLGLTGIAGNIGATGLQGFTGLMGRTGLTSAYRAVNIAANYSILPEDYLIFISVNNNLNVTLTLPLASVVGAGKMYSVRTSFGTNTSSAGDVIVATSGSDLINGQNLLIMKGGDGAHQIADLYCNGTHYFARGALFGPRGATGVQGVTGAQGSLNGIQGITGVEFN